MVRNRHYASCSNIYHSLHKNGFEFTHHDVLSCESARASIALRIARLDNLRGKSRIRINEDLSIDAILERAEEFLDFLQRKRGLLRHDRLYANHSERQEESGLERDREILQGPRFLPAYVQAMGGENQDAFWARNDDDLIALMLRKASMPK